MTIDEFIRKNLLLCIIIPILLVAYYIYSSDKGEVIFLGQPVPPIIMYALLVALIYIGIKMNKYLDILEQELKWRTAQKPIQTPQPDNNKPQPIQPPLPPPPEEELFKFSDDEPFPNPNK